ncbi:MAG: hypothetical protein IJP31_00980 [Lachnospiraceae bacterium]|nr:hypothetical protein [Lachnospiraceae bacterium]
MKTAKLFFFGLYTHLLLSIAIPVMLLYYLEEGWNEFSVKLLLFYIGMIGIVLIAGLIAMMDGIKLYKTGEFDELKEAWCLLKLDTLPFYLLNFFWSLLAWVMLIGGTRGLMALLLPIPILITCGFIVESGVIGILYIRALKKKENQEYKPGIIHYFLQLFSILDIISSIRILWKTDRQSLPEKLKLFILPLFTGLAGGAGFYLANQSFFRKPVAILDPSSLSYQPRPELIIGDILLGLSLLGLIFSLILIFSKKKNRITELVKLLTLLVAGIEIEFVALTISPILLGWF